MSYTHALVGRQHGDEYEKHLKRVLEYILKESDEQSRELYGLRARPKGGVVHGKRIGTSQNVAEAARNRVSWRFAGRSSPTLPQRIGTRIFTDQPDFAYDFRDLQTAAPKGKLG